MTQCLLVVVALASLAGSDAVAPRAARVGQIIIIGNEAIPQDLILDRLPLCAGQILTYPDLRRAERMLAPLRLLGIASTVVVLDVDPKVDHKDILVAVQETAITHLLFRAQRAVLRSLQDE
jgi:hypothetical protein